MSFINSLEIGARKFRLFLYKPLLAALTKLKVKAIHITWIAFLSAILMFYFLMAGRHMMASIFFLVFFIVDTIDGSLARYQKKESDRGKFADILVDNIAATLITIGLIIKGLLNPANGAVFIYIMIVTIFFSTVYNTAKHKSDWLIFPKGGASVHLPREVFFVVFALWGFGINTIPFDALVFAANAYLLAVALVFFSRIWKFKKRKK